MRQLGLRSVSRFLADHQYQTLFRNIEPRQTRARGKGHQLLGWRRARWGATVRRGWHLQFGAGVDEMHGISAVREEYQWRPNFAWLGLAAFVVVASLSTNVAEIVYAYLLHDPRVIFGRHPVDRVFDDLARVLMYLVGFVILWRAGKRQSCFILGVAIMALIPFPLFPPAVLSVFSFLVGPLAYLMPAFAIARLDESGLRVNVAVRFVFFLGFAARTLPWVLQGFFPDVLSSPTGAALLTPMSFVGYLLIPLLTAGLLGYGWRWTDGQEGDRFFVLLVAVSILILGNALFSIFNSTAPVFPRWVTITSSVIRITGAFLFAYAVLKHRVIDIGFVINRTLVYGAVTFTLLAAFGLAEYGLKSVIPEQGAEASSVIAAATAVLLFLSFHQVHHWFEHQIERLFFHSWHVAEAELKRFVSSAGQFTSESALCASFTDELRRFSQGAEVALFLRCDEDGFCLESGGLADTRDRYAEEDRAFALMRAERQPIEMSRAHSALPGELAAPMLDQRGLAGFVLLGAKRDGSHFRPDQEENIGWATQQVALDLQALKARALNRELAGLRGQLAAAVAERDRLMSSITVR